MQRSKNYTHLLLGSLLTIAVASPAWAQKDVDRILAELRQIQAQLSQLQNTQNALEQRLTQLTEGSREERSALRKNFADSQLTLERMREEVSVLSSRVDETNGRLGNIRREVASLRQTQQPLALPLPEEGEESEVAAEGNGDEGQGELPVVAAAPSETDIYNQARTDYTQGRYPLAIAGFKELVASNREGDLADNAYYWMGEAYLNQNQYERALQAFDTIIRDYPDSNKRPDAYYKKAQTLEFMERRSEAMLMYELVIEQFPRTQHQRIARSRLEELMRTTPPQ